MLGAGLEQHLGRFDVVGGVDLEVPAPALAHAGLSREMEHVRAILEESGQVGLLDSRFHEPEPGLLACASEILLLDDSWIEVRERIDAHDIGTGAQEMLGESRADEAGDASDEGSHRLRQQ